MRVIKEGNKPELSIHLGKCSNCKTEVEFQRHEGIVTHDQRDGSYVTVECPICGGKIHSNI